MAIIVDKISYLYGEGLKYEKNVLNNISVEIPDNQFIGLIGHTGSGKSTFIQHLNGLLKATEGTIYFKPKDGEGFEDIYDRDFSMKKLRSKVGLVFQYPEHQLFETTVEKDVQFGPKNLGLPLLEVQKRSYDALKLVGIGDDLLDASPFELSGGQKRRVAIAGVLAMQPEVLILDEPTAGLDPKGRREILDRIAEIQKERSITVVLVSHSMEDVAEYVDRILVMNDGTLMMDGTPKEIFARREELERMGLAVPQVTYACDSLRRAGFEIPNDIITVDEAADTVYSILKGKSGT